MRIRLVVTEGPERGRVFEFDQRARLLVGRSRRAHLTVAEDDVFFSRVHLAIEVQPPRCYVQDLHSTNGTVVNEQTLARDELRRLGPGDVVGGGSTYFRVEYALDPRERAGDVDLVLPAAQSSDLDLMGGPGPRAAGPPAARGDDDLQLDGSVDRSGPFILDRSLDHEPLHCRRCGATEPAQEARARLGGEQDYLCEACRQALLRQPPVAPALDDYEVLDEILVMRQGRPERPGGMGAIYRARRRSNGRMAAVKTIIPEEAVRPEALARFERERQIATRLRHPNIVESFDTGRLADGRLFIAMELADGGNALELAERTGGRLAPTEAGAIIRQALSGVSHAHSQGVIHRDLKPQNLLLFGERPRVTKVTDFGLAKDADAAGLTRPAQMLGTLPYMPPEQVLDCRRATPQMDVYAMGASLYVLLSGQPTHEFGLRRQGRQRSPVEVLLEDNPVPLGQRVAGLPARLVAVVDRAMAREPGRRFATADEMRRALEQAL